jgi:polysaccharide deacetylase family protein (PEP-CTERM system associated)
MALPVTFTLDFEDLRTSPTQESRVEYATSLILDRMAELDIRGTIFCVAEVAQREPELLRRMTDLGHEIAVHGLQHTPIDLLGPQRFHEQTIRAKDILEQLSGQEVVGFRAPQFSVVPETSWALDILAEVGFTYTSSILPVATLMYGWPGAPMTPFRWPQGMVEIPCPVVRFMGVTIPFLGGAYMRVLPSLVRRRGMRAAPQSSVLWTYCHPWEFDPDEPFYVYEHGGWLVSRIGWINRGGMLRRVEKSMHHASGPPLREVVGSLGDLQIFDPAASDSPRAAFQGKLRRRATV